MSTRKIREALDALSDCADHPNARIDVRELLVDAEKEVTAIEEAARSVTRARDGEKVPGRTLDAGWDTLERVAETAPRKPSDKEKHT